MSETPKRFPHLKYETRYRLSRKCNQRSGKIKFILCAKWIYYNTIIYDNCRLHFIETSTNLFFQPRHVDTQCTLSCNEGYRLVGSKTRICLPIALWTGVQASCKRKNCKNKLYTRFKKLPFRAPVKNKKYYITKYHITAIKCPRLRRPNYGEIYPSDCTNSRMPFEGRCAFSCHAGFQLQGPSLRQCVSPGRWNGGNLMTRCVGKHMEFAIVWSWKLDVWNM